MRQEGDTAAHEALFTANSAVSRHSDGPSPVVLESGSFKVKEANGATVAEMLVTQGVSMVTRNTARSPTGRPPWLP